MDLTKSINYFKSLIDKNGVVQFTDGYARDYSYGYAIEDQARALILSIALKDTSLIDKFFILIESSLIPGKGVDVLRDVGGKLSGRADNFGEASAEVVWAISELKATDYGRKYDPSIDNMLENLIPGLSITKYPRVMAYMLLGLAKIRNKSVNMLADRLLKFYKASKSDNWFWFENELTYANSLFPWSLLLTYELTKDGSYLKVAEESMHFLFKTCVKDGFPIVVGNEGWWKKGEVMPLYGQQPIDFSYLILSCLDAERITGKREYAHMAKFYFSWFSGNNLNGQNMIREDGACYDGLYKDGVNKNAGAESNICFLLASLKIRDSGLKLNEQVT